MLDWWEMSENGGERVGILGNGGECQGTSWNIGEGGIMQNDWEWCRIEGNGVEW